MKLISAIRLVALLCASVAVGACVGTAPSKELRLIDSLNQQAYAFRYKNIDSSCHAAMQAYKSVNLYRAGEAEACNNLGFCAFMRMDFEEAERYFRKVYSLTKNELELLIADIGFMKIYQRTALNKEFYDYRNSALRRMRRIGEDNNLFVDRHERARLEYARSEFYIVSAVYYYYLQQRSEALDNIGQLKEAELASDTSQLLYYYYIKGAASLCEADTLDSQRLLEFDALYKTWRIASRKGYVYFEGNGIQGLVNLMASPTDYELFKLRRGHALKQFGYPVDSLLPLRLGQLALQKFRQYNDLYQIAGAYVSIGKYLNAHGRYTEALDTLKLALECVNRHHRLFYNCHDSLDWMKAADYRDNTYAEHAWMEQKLRTVPEWISRIREQLSVSYSGLGMKEYSDYNRNIYLDILENTRQDKELESRYQALATESRQLNLILVSVILGLVGVVIFFWFFNSNSKRRNKQHLYRLRQMLDICQKITAAIPADAQTEQEIIDAILNAVRPQMESLFGVTEIGIENGQFVLSGRVGKDEQAMLRVINPYVQWALDNGMTTISLGDECRRLEKQRYIYEQHIAGNKRQNLVKKACLAIVNGIHPYIDRIINEVHKIVRNGSEMDRRVRREKYEYLDELVTAINEYNDILALWIKMRQGTLSLNIENFALDDLFQLIRKGTRAFEMKQLTLEVEPTTTWVKADKALTLFMINTLAENARKYTPAGGFVRVYARQEADYVEISVEDNGCGLSSEDVAHIVGEKVYDSKNIGMDLATDREALQKNKGSGFGLMNCRGIIEKYKKTNELFRVCLFSVDSTPGKGSRFYFRLPVGVRKVLVMLAVLLGGTFGLSSCGKGAEMQTSESPVSDSLEQVALYDYELLLDSASNYADAAYYCNVDGQYEWALQYIDSAMLCLNKHYRMYAPDARRTMTLEGSGEPAELDWWNELFNSDYHVILDIRNEAAVAFLALKQWDAYRYNNDAYTILYKLLGEDQSLEDYCRQLERSTNNKMVGIWLAVMLVIALLAGYYVLYFRKRLVNRWNLEQVLEINQAVFAASNSDAVRKNPNRLDEVPRQIVNEAFDAINELLCIDRLSMAVYDESSHQLEYVSCPGDVYMADAAESQDKDAVMAAQQRRTALMRSCYEEKSYQSQSGIQVFPLTIETAGSNRCIGALCIERSEGSEQSADRLLLELIIRYVAIVVFNAVVKLAVKYRDIELAQDEARRASWEDSMLHVQNMVLDNCLSTIKHETIYYPSKIKQLIGKLRTGELSAKEEEETVTAIAELIDYYKGIFSILSQCASRQLEEVTFRRSAVKVADLMTAAEKYFRKARKNRNPDITFHIQPFDGCVLGDVNQLQFLLENLIDEALSNPQSGEIRLEAAEDDRFIRFFFVDTRRDRTQEELNRLFYPSLERMSAVEQGRLKGTEYLICKQIIRDHDEFAGLRGCRINAQVNTEERGFTVYFTIPRAGQ